jgi:hypothetical protein
MVSIVGSARPSQGGRREIIESRARKHSPRNDAERDAYAAVYAYEEVKSTTKRRFRANRTWQAIERHGIIQAVERLVTRATETEGYRARVAAGLEEMAFEAVILRHPEVFSTEAVAAASERMARLHAIGLNKDQ